MSMLGSLFTPETELLKARYRALDANTVEEERLAGAATQESREALRGRRREIMKMMGRIGGTSQDINDMLTGVEQEQMAEERGISNDLLAHQSDLKQRRQQIATIIPTREAQEWWQVGKDVASTAATVAAPFAGPAAPFLAAGGAALRGGDVGDSLDYLKGFDEWRERYKTRSAA